LNSVREPYSWSVFRTHNTISNVMLTVYCTALWSDHLINSPRIFCRSLLIMCINDFSVNKWNDGLSRMTIRGNDSNPQEKFSLKKAWKASSDDGFQVAKGRLLQVHTVFSIQFLNNDDIITWSWQIYTMHLKLREDDGLKLNWDIGSANWFCANFMDAYGE
jgi:hypothetical protein